MDENEKTVEEVKAANTEEQAGAQGEGAQDGATEQQRKYTDADVDKIIARKIAKEREKMSKLFNEGQQESELEIRERNVLERELKADAKESLIADGMPPMLADIFNYGSKDDYEKSYNTVAKAFREIMDEEVKRRFAGPTPRVGTGTVDTDRQKVIRNAFAPSQAQ